MWGALLAAVLAAQHRSHRAGLLLQGLTAEWNGSDRQRINVKLKLEDHAFLRSLAEQEQLAMVAQWAAIRAMAAARFPGLPGLSTPAAAAGAGAATTDSAADVPAAADARGSQAQAEGPAAAASGSKATPGAGSQPKPQAKGKARAKPGVAKPAGKGKGKAKKRAGSPRPWWSRKQQGVRLQCQHHRWQCVLKSPQCLPAGKQWAARQVA